MEEKERDEVMSPSLNGYAYIHDFKTDNVLNTYDSCDLLNQQDKENQQLKQQLEESEKETKHWHDLYKDRDNQFQSIRQRYHLLNRLQAKYDDKNKLHLSEMHCLELVNENEQLRQQLNDLPKKIVEEIRDCLLDFSNGWWRYFMTDGCEYMLSSDLQGCLNEIIDAILKKFGDKNESNND